jgi:hypothetical protein
MKIVYMRVAAYLNNEPLRGGAGEGGPGPVEAVHTTELRVHDEGMFQRQIMRVVIRGAKGKRIWEGSGAGF